MVCNNYRRNSKLNVCTSHGFNYDNLEKVILQTMKQLFQDIDSKKVNLNIEKSKTKYDYSKLLKKLETEITMINDNIDKMYIDKLNRKISDEMHERLSRKVKK